ncbi:MAG: DUF2304 domain-containing protein [Bryobacteraceae bacterium]
MDRLLNVLTGLSCALIAFVLISVRRAHIRVEYSVSWLAAALVLLILSRFRGLLTWITAALGVDAPADALIMMVFCVFLVVFYRFSIVISDLKDANIAMTQRVAILEFELQSANEDRQAQQSQ